ncbi:methyl-accepting chemotaxis protein [Oceanobacillus picturae]|uniref:methyl-accepting chemotaxis protein n=1 Tax=Oceanobacillus picturae TaxID=171693 RepID=UPI00363F52E9
MKLKLKLGTKINLIVLSVILLFSAVIGIVVNNEITKGVKEFAIEKAKGDLSLAYRYLDNKYTGEWEIKNNQLYKGTTLMNENFEIVDKIGQDTGDTVTIFQGETRIATNVMKDGNRAIGTRASQEVLDTVIKDDENFYGEANVAGKYYQTAYMPLKDSNGEVIGIFYVGASQSIINQILTSFLITFGSVLVIMLLLSFIVVYWFTKRLKKRLSVIAETITEAGKGDLTSKIEDKAGDELTTLSPSFNLMVENLRTMMNEVNTSSELVASSSEELNANSEETSKATETITESIQQVADGAEQSTVRVQESVTFLEQVTKGVQTIATNAFMVSEVSTKATERAKQGGLLVDNTVKQINEIGDSVKVSGEVFKSLDKRSQEIDEITKVISGIAEQTNLLALNAAIEAARAGENGKGFAVVADEVRKLAEQSQFSSAQISKLVKEIQNDMELSSQSIKKVSKDVKAGFNIVSQTEVKFREIDEFLERLSVEINNMASTADEVSTSTQEVFTTVSGITDITNNTSMHSQNVAASAEEQLASMEEITASSNSLSTLAEDLQKLISKFKV